ncbi:MAG: preprotein translocase subunit YajC [Alphaproteobacteria bacterium]|jgi:preprotein translocase subunit YajC|nr:preprotein translocase subunit YajC [Alphaproteobacteria bacterium]OJU56277.1 MAG: preprotein translocase subunit YajC [Alphaproteobacteria bacterium 62-8]MBN9556221.1 preprotein translocase subunit YajC [Alphaproteobacteria bacterium]MBN9569424.1 preprotein translocase subunit YajC [Alphaproteobacteria bacterium]MBN9571491.1 preprotein translocase subunit YajC [Alphaproteobacteria bacterium]
MDQSFLTSIVPLIAIFAIMYFLMIRPQQQRVKKHREMVDGVRRGDTAITSGGIVGKVIKVKDDGEIMLEIADGVQVRVVKSTLSDVRAKSQPADAKADKD